MDEVQMAADVLVRDLLRMKRGETVLVYGDPGTDPRVVKATIDAVEARGGRPLEMWFRIRGPPGTEPPKAVAEAMKASDAIVEFARTYLITTKAFQRALDAKARHLCLTGMDADMMVRCIGNVSLRALKGMGGALSRITARAKEGHVLSPAGTDLRFRFGKRPVILDTGECVTPGRDSYLGGQISWAAVEDTIKGTIALDGTIWPPDDLAPLREPVRLEVRRGRVTSIEGGESAGVLRRWIQHFRDRRMLDVAHFCFGFNPGARITGRILEDERVYGSFVTGLGSQQASFHGKLTLAKSHIDGTTLRPTVLLDGIEIEREGSFVHPLLVARERDLLRSAGVGDKAKAIE
jgi:2,5-dihydroxypyridine 5,6-dioxygenase